MNESLYIAKLDFRIINQIIDLAIIFILWVVTSAVLMVFFNIEDIDSKPILYAIVAPIFMGYYFILEFLTQKTLGKVITKTKVVSMTGSKPSAVQIFIRTICRCIPFEYLSYLISTAGLHDRLSATRVINI